MVYFNPPGFVSWNFNPLTLISSGGSFFRADMGVGLTSTSSGVVTSSSTDKVTVWTDQSPQVYLLAWNWAGSGPDGSAPVYSTSSFNNHPGITFTANKNAALEGVGVNAIGPTTTLSVFSFFSLNSRFGGNIFQLDTQSDFVAPSFFTGFGTAGGTTGFTVWSQPSTFGVVGSSAAGAQGNGQVLVSGSTGNFYLWGGTFDGSHCNVFLNGAQVGSPTTFSETLGTGSSGAQNLPIVGAGEDRLSCGVTVAYCGITAKVMSATDWSNLYNWGKSNWGL